MIKLYRLLLLGTALVTFSCQSTSEVMIAESDLIGSWRSITVNGVADLSFSQSDGLNRYVFSAPDGDFGSISLLPGSNVLSQGLWSIAGNVLALLDEDGFPLTCPETDRYIVEMSSSGAAITLTSGGSEPPCLTRSQIFEEAGWLLQTEAQS